MIAKDVMTSSPWVIYTNDSIKKAADIFVTHKPSTIPVLLPSGEVHGVLSEVPLLKVYVKLKVKSALSQMIMGTKDLIEPAVCVRERDPIAVVMQACMKVNHHRVLVLDEYGFLKGVVSPKDLLALLHGEPGESISMQEELKALRARVTEMEQSQEKLKVTALKLKNYETMFSKSPFMFHSVDSTGKIVVANPRLHQVLGYQDGELLNKMLYDLYPESIWPMVEKGLQHVLMQGSRQMFTEYQTKSGKPVKVEILSQAILDPNGKFLATSTIARLIDSDSLLHLLDGAFK